MPFKQTCSREKSDIKVWDCCNKYFWPPGHNIMITSYNFTMGRGGHYFLTHWDILKFHNKVTGVVILQLLVIIFWPAVSLLWSPKYFTTLSFELKTWPSDGALKFCEVWLKPYKHCNQDMAQRAQNNQTSVSLKGHNITEGQVLPKTVSRVLRWRQTKGKIGKANVSYLK